MSAYTLRAQANRRVDDAVTEGLAQMAKDWRPREVAAVLADAATVVDDLRAQARVAEGHEICESLRRSSDWFAANPRIEATS